MSIKPDSHRDSGPAPGEPDTPALDSIVAEAEAALGEIAENYIARLQEAVRAMREALVRLRDDPAPPPGALQELHGLAHNVKGQAGSFGYGLVSQVAGSLCSFIAGHEARAIKRLDIVGGHLDALEVIAGQDIRGDGGALGRQLMSALQEAIAQAAAG